MSHDRQPIVPDDQHTTTYVYDGSVPLRPAPGATTHYCYDATGVLAPRPGPESPDEPHVVG